MKSLFGLLVGLLLAGCSGDPPSFREHDPQAFADYWNQGKAELTRYSLKQARYGETYEGDAVLIFVTESFLDDKQVKQEHGNDRAYPVLKLNATRQFTTGIYPYSLMTSVFSQVSPTDPFTAKVTFSAQEWCGQVYMQLNANSDGYRGVIHSYFQDEADQKLELEGVALEDDLWTRIRLAPKTLPLGDINLVPALHALRLDHLPTRAYPAEAELTEEKDRTFSSDRLYCYRLTYPEIERKLEIYFEREAPYRIKGWRETGKPIKDAQQVTEAIATHELMTDYWTHHRYEDWTWRKKLGLK